MTAWRWSKPKDHDTVAAKQHATKYQTKIGQLLEAAAADENVDFAKLVTAVKSKADNEQAKKSGPKGK